VREPQWRAVLCWGTVITFLTLPLLIFILAFTSEEYGWSQFHEHIRDYKFVGSFYQSITALAFGLSGLRSVDKYVEAKNGKPPSKTPE
jgi:ABC-type sulfate transport system permease component